MSSTPAIEIRGLRFRYPNSDFALALDEWTLPAGGRVALHGSSGCGKSTLLNLIAGVLVPDAGSLKVEGRDLSTMGDAARRAWRIQRMGFVFQDFPLVGYLDALDNVLLPYRLNPALHLDAAARQRAHDLLGELGLDHRRHHRPEALSQGERQRVAIARALVNEPALLLADEPTTGLDGERSAALMELLESLSQERGLSLVLVTHDPGLRARFDTALDVNAITTVS